MHTLKLRELTHRIYRFLAGSSQQAQCLVRFDSGRPPGTKCIPRLFARFIDSKNLIAGPFFASLLALPVPDFFLGTRRFATALTRKGHLLLKWPCNLSSLTRRLQSGQVCIRGWAGTLTTGCAKSRCGPAVCNLHRKELLTALRPQWQNRLSVLPIRSSCLVIRAFRREPL